MNTIKTRTAGAIIVNPDKAIAIVSNQGTSWGFPKGHIEGGESPRDAAVREIKEETGLTDLHFVKELGTYERYRISDDPKKTNNMRELKSITLFLFTTPQTDLHPIDPENPEARWVPKDAVADLLTHQKDKEFFRSILNQLP